VRPPAKIISGSRMKNMIEEKIIKIKLFIHP
jgi:hypothetical protein